MMYRRFNEISYDNITDLIGYRYRTNNIIPSELGRKIMEEIKISEETESVITGSYSDWCHFVLYVIDKYLENSTDHIQPDNKSKGKIPDCDNHQKIINEYEKSVGNPESEILF
jgi:hypothetical protein